MSNRKSRLLKEIRELLKSVDRKLDKLLDRQVSQDLGLGPRQKKLLKQLAKSDLSLNASKILASEPHLQVSQSLPELDTYRRIEDEVRRMEDRASFVPGTFVSLPEHLRQTMQSIATFGQATALQVSEKTGRSRAAESDYLNQLVDRDFLKKARRGREIVFQVFSLHTLCPMCGRRVPLNVKFCSFCGAALYRPEQIERIRRVAEH